MRITIIATAALALSMAGMQGVAAADPHMGHGDSIRYASVKGCPKKDGSSVPCGPWRLVTHGGKTMLLKDAQVLPLSWKGKPSSGAVAPITVSGNGQKVAYFHKGGQLAIRGLTGRVRVLPKTALPKKTNQWDVTLELSDDGSKLAAAVTGEHKSVTLLFDTATGATLGSLPGTESFVDFSGDGGEVLTSGDGDESVTELHVYDTSGTSLLSGTPPQIIAGNSPYALNADGERVAAIVNGPKPALVVYNLRSDAQAAKHRIKLPKDNGVDMVDWTGDSQVTVHMSRSTSKGTKMKIIQIDANTGATKVRDTYTVLADSFSYAACGG